MLHRIMLALTALVCLSGAPAEAGNVLIGSSPPTQPSGIPVVSGAGNSVSYQAGGSAAIIDPSIVTTCNCSNLSSATITISSGAFTNDALTFTPQSGIAGVFAANVLTLSGSASPASYTAALRSVSYASSNADPTNSGSNPTRTITWQTVNGSNNSNTPTSLINVSLPPAVPTISSAGNTVTYTAGGSATALDSSITAACSCSNLTGAVISISAGLLSGDALNFTNQFSITGTYSSTTGILTLTGTDTKTHYNTALQSITYSSTLTDPTNAGADPTRTVNWQVSNTTANSAPGSITTVNVQVNAQPTLSSAGNTVTYTAGGSATIIDNAIIVSCTCTNLTGATLMVQPAGFFAGDLLNFSNQLGITGSYNGATGLLTLTGTTTLANYQTALRTITYSSTATDPTNAGANPSRAVTWVAQNSTSNSNPVTSTINVFLGGQPSWAMTGATVAVNGQTNQCWISGSGTTTLSTCLNVTRASTETCYNTTGPAFVTYASANVGCAEGNGLAAWGIYTNYLPASLDASNGAWNAFAQGGAGNSVTVTGNSVTDPTNVTTQAAKVAIVRTSAGNYASVIGNQINAPIGAYSGGVWLKADGGGDVGKVIDLAFLTPGGVYSVNQDITLTSTWTNYTFAGINIATACTAVSTNCQFQVGYNNQRNPAIAAVNFDMWGAELNQGTQVYPVLTTTSGPASSTFDNITAVSSSAMENALDGAASSVIMVTAGGTPSTASTVVDTNGIVWLGETAANNLTTAVGSSSTTSNTATWTGVVTSGYARNSSGRTFALNNGNLVKDSQSTTIGTPVHFGSTSGNASPLNGYIQTINVFNTRVGDGIIGVSGGTKYYFAAAGSDANPCTLASPCQSITKVNSINLTTNDQVNFNGGDTFVGCVTFNGASNLSSTRAAPVTFQSYGSGQATLTPNCTATAAKIGVINLISADGVIINNLKFVDDAAGNANRGINLENADATKSHGTITIQNSTFNSFHDGAASGNDHGAAIFLDVSLNNFTNGAMIDHVTLLNNTVNGLSGTTSTDNDFVGSYGNPGNCFHQFDMVQGNLVFNLGGDAAGIGSSEGNGMVFTATCGPGTTGAVPNGLNSGIAQFNVVHDMAANVNACGGPGGIWTFGSDSVIIRMNEVYNYHSAGGCDHLAYDLDNGTTNSLVERNYSHNNWGPCVIYFGSGSQNTIRWNVCDNDSSGLGSGVFSWNTTSGATSYTYNNVFNLGSTATGYAIGSFGCPAAGSIFANNVIIQHNASSGLYNLMYLQGLSGSSACPVGSGGLTVANNDWFFTGSGNSPLGRNGNSTSATFAAFETLFSETGGLNVNPQFSGTIGANVTCNSTVGSPGPQANGCPAGYTLASGSPMAAPAGATLTSAPYNLPTTIGGVANKYNGQGTLSYYGATLPCSGGGFPIGADCGTTAAPPSFSLSFTSGTLPSCSGCNVAFTGGANGSFYNASNVLVPVNSANNPRFDHNPSNGQALGILIEPANGNYWASSIMTAGNTISSDSDHQQLCNLIFSCPAGSHTTQITTSNVGVWGVAQEAVVTGPDNVANTGGYFREDTCNFTTSGSPASPTGCGGSGDTIAGCTTVGGICWNNGDGGHASLNAILPGTNGSTPFQATNRSVIVSEYVRQATDANDAGRGFTLFAADTGGNHCQAFFNLQNGTFPSNSFFSQGSYSCGTTQQPNPVIESINIAGNLWYRTSFITATQTDVVRINSTLTTNGTNQTSNYTGDGHSGINVYGNQITPLASGAVAICIPGVSGPVPCTANSYIANTNTYNAPVNRTADSLSFTVPSGLCALTYTFDDNSTQKLTLGGSCSTSSTNVTVPTTLNRPWIKTIVGSVN